MRILLNVLLPLATAGLVVLSFLALVETNRWWVRMTDFPRLQYAIALIVLLVVLALSRPVAPRVRAVLAAVALAALAYNAIKIGPYFVGDHQTIASCEEDRQFTIMVANVKLENRRAEELLQMVRKRAPDILLALETNEWWDRHLSALSDTMPYSVAEITGSYFGMHLLSALPLEETQTIFPVNQDAPSILATVRLRSGGTIRFIGLHPRPPHPGQSATGRDAELMWGAQHARDSALPAVLAGDLNAVPWERTVERSQRIGELIDPRDFEGFMPTYDAHSWWMSWPLDQVLYQEGVTVMSMSVLPGFGSDHYPIEVTFCHRPTDRKAPALRSDDLAEAQRTIDTAVESPSKSR